MKYTLLAIFAICLIGPACLHGQNAQVVPPPNYNGPAPSGLRADSVAGDISRISQSVESLNRNLEKFFTNFSSNQGLRLTERQQRLLFALEVLSRSEASLTNNQKQRLDQIERLSRLRLQLAGVKDNLLPQSLDRYASLRGTTNAVELRESRRAVLEKERIELTTAIDQVQYEVDRLTESVRRAELQVTALRERLFGQVEKELADL